MASAIFTVGHSNRSGPDLLAMLLAHGIALLADVRKIPRSRFNPQFNDRALARELADHGIRYLHLPELGGKRPPTEGSRNSYFRANGGLQSYADYMVAPEFHEAIGRLLALAAKERVAVMCAEAKPEQCHRQLVADAVLLREVPVIHILSPEETRTHVMHKAARIDAAGQLYYPKEETAQMPLI
jgi:uncharacterized protein (DUF488 family)